MQLPRPQSEEGFTIIEALVAAIVLTLGALAVFMAFTAAIHNVQRAREQQVGVSVAQREMERVRVIPFDQIGMSSLPTPVSDPRSPYSRLRQVGAETEFDLDRGAGEDWRTALAGGEVQPETSGVRTSDGTEVTVFRFVACEEAACDAKRVVIDVLRAPRANQGSYRASYYELQSTIVDPDPLGESP